MQLDTPVPARRVATVEEAIALAQALQAEGRYDWFRGQVVNWRVKPSFVRASAEDRKLATERLDRFDRWCRGRKDLSRASAELDSVIAIAQHYGLRTTFVDFTTDPEVAGFFATDGDPKQVKAEQQLAGTTESAIILVKTSDLIGYFEDIAPIVDQPNRIPRCLAIDVENLWRLQGQKGVFLDCKFEDIESDYGFDRILFPYDEKACSRIPRHRIYPTRKSPLEQALDHYFGEEVSRTAAPAFYRMLLSMGMGTDNNPILANDSSNAAALRRLVPGIKVTSPDKSVGLYVAEAINDEDLSPAAGWTEDALAAWSTPIAQHYLHVLEAVALKVQVPEHFDGTSVEPLVKQVARLLSNQSDLRGKLTGWTVEGGPPSLGTLRREHLTKAVTRIWDGMRVLPYSNDQIAKAVGTCVALACVWDFENADMNATLKSAAQLFPNPSVVEFGISTGSYSRAIASSDALLAAVRSDVGGFVKAEHAARAGDIRFLLNTLFTPWLLFDFGRLVDLFAAAVIPTQALWRSRDALFFSPVQVHRFGLP